MEDFFVRIYDFFKRHRIFNATLMLLCLALFVGLASSLSYKEDITDFLPVDGRYKKAMSTYQELNSGDRIFVFVGARDHTIEDKDSILALAKDFVEILKIIDENNDIKDITSEIDYDKYLGSIDFVYENIPYFLTESDYCRLDSINTDYIKTRLETDKELLMLPTGNLLSDNIIRDPLNLYSPVVERIMQTRPSIGYEIYDGHIFTKDFKKAIIILTSPYGANETKGNARIVELLDKSIANLHDKADITYIGNSSIAVSNANRIKADSVWTVALAVILIGMVLWFYFKNIRNILLIVFSLLFGWLFALAVIASTRDDVSIIVLGIASVIIGIAVNYPLHYLAHLKHNPDKRASLKELVRPLLIGNITTVGAFCALIPLESSALRDLGIFSAMMLMGTIAFVLFFLPHLASSSTKIKYDEHEAAADGKVNFLFRQVAIGIILILTVVFAYFSTFSSFDSNMQNINYMTDQQKELFASLRPIEDGTVPLYVISEGKDWNQALERNERIDALLASLPDSIILGNKSISAFVGSDSLQKEKLKRWDDFVCRNDALINDTLLCMLREEEFSAEAFEPFFHSINDKYVVKDYSEFKDNLTDNIKSLSCSASDGCIVVSILSVDKGELDNVKNRINDFQEGTFAFDIASLNGTIANSLSDNFNYIGWACGLIVFFFLWISFGRLELAVVAFLPMAISWIWILGLMYLLGIQFNIVNIILATFIFGQGDDYTIFMLDGLIYEYTYRKKILKSYKTSILLSSIIMFIGIGVLIFAKHPALFSLAQVTLIGMGTVILMTYVIPPFIYGWLVSGLQSGRLRYFPITLKNLAMTAVSGSVFFFEVFIGLVIGFWNFFLHKKTPERMMAFHNLIYHFFKWNRRWMPGIKYEIINQDNEDFTVPRLVICNHQSTIDPMALLALSPRLLIVTGKRVWASRSLHRLLGLCDFIPAEDGIDSLIEKSREYVAWGYSIVVFPEGILPDDGSITRFHQGAARIAKSLRLDIVPVYMHGLFRIMPKTSPVYRSGTCTLKIGEPIHISDFDDVTVLSLTKCIHSDFVKNYDQLRDKLETPDYFAPYVRDAYTYKSVANSVDSRMKKFGNYRLWLEQRFIGADGIVVINNGCGEVGLLAAWINRDMPVYAYDGDKENLEIARSISKCPRNLFVIDDIRSIPEGNFVYLLVEPSQSQIELFSGMTNIIIE